MNYIIHIVISNTRYMLLQCYISILSLLVHFHCTSYIKHFVTKLIKQLHVHVTQYTKGHSSLS